MVFYRIKTKMIFYTFNFIQDMKQYLLLCLLSLTLLGSYAIKREGTLELKNWAPFRGMKSAPQIESITLKWVMDDNDGTGTPIRIAAVKWKIGEFYMWEGQKYPVSSLSGVIDKLSITQLSLKSNLCFKAGQSNYTTFMEMGGFVSKSGEEYGPDKRDFIDWKTLFTDMEADSAKIIFAKNFILCNLQVAGIEFGGTQIIEEYIRNQGKETECNAKIAEGDQAMKEDNYVRAEGLYLQALQLIPNHPIASGKLNKARFFIGVGNGDAAFKNGEYARSKQLYWEALRLLPDDQSAKNLIEGKVREADIQLAKAEYGGLLKKGDEAVKQGDFNTAKSHYEQAARIFPNDATTQSEIQARMQNVAGMIAQAQFNQFMALGDAALRNKDFNAAAGYYQQALMVFPGHPQASAALAECERQIELLRKYEYTVQDLTNQYLKRAQEVGAEWSVIVQKAAEAFDAAVEGCNLEYARYYACMGTYFQKKSESAAEEAKWIVFGDASGKSKFDIPNMCIKPNCNAVDNTDAAQKAPSQSWLEAAKRKYNYAKNNSKSASTFLSSAEFFTQTALQKDNQNVNALAFSAVFGQDLVESMSILQRALYLSPSNSDALALKAEYEKRFIPELFYSIEKGDFSYLKRAADSRLLTGLVQNGVSPAQFAVDKNQGEILGLVLGGVVAETGTQNIQNLLFRAVDKNSKSCVNILMQYGAKPDIPNEKGETALTIASRKGYKEIVEALSEQSLDKGNALVVAVMENQVAAAKSLIEKGANPEIKDKNGDNLLMLAIQKKNEQMAEMLIAKGANVNHQNFKEETPLSFAVHQGLGNIVALLLNENASPADALAILKQQSEKETEYLAVTTAMYAIDKNRPEFTPLILKYYPKVAYALNDKKEAVIFYCLGKNAFEIGKEFILNPEIDLNQAIAGKYLLTEVAILNRKEWLESMLTRKDLNLNVSNLENQTALHIAAQKGLTEIVTMLIKAGIDKEMKDKAGNTALMIAAENGNENIVKTLTAAGVSMKTRNAKNLQAIHLAVIAKDIEVVEILLDKGADVNVAGDSGLTPLHYAAQMGNSDIARVLLGKGASKTAIDNFKRTPSKLAAKYKHKALAKMLK